MGAANQWGLLQFWNRRCWFFNSHSDTAQLPPCYLSSALALGFVVPKSEFCFVDVLPNAIAENPLR
jgi:hypothetical protein